MFENFCMYICGRLALRAIVDMPMYMQPLQAKGWDIALLDYARAIFTSSSPEHCKPPTSSRLHEITCPGNIISNSSF